MTAGNQRHAAVVLEAFQAVYERVVQLPEYEQTRVLEAVGVLLGNTVQFVGELDESSEEAS